MALTTAPVELVSLDGSVTINDSSADVDFRVESDGNQHMLFVDAGNDHVNIGTSTDYGGVLNIETTDNGTNLLLASTDTDANAGPVLVLYRQSTSSAADGDAIGKIDVMAYNDANQNITFAQIAGLISDASDGSEDGQLQINLMSSASSRSFVDFIGSTGTVFNEGSVVNLDFRVESDSNSHMLFVDAGNDAVGIGTSSPVSNSGYGGLTLNGTSGSIFSLMHNGTEKGRIVGGSSSLSIQYPSDGVLTFFDGVSGGTERARFDSSGNLLVGTTASRTLSGVTPSLFKEGTGYNDSAMALVGNTGTTAATAPLLLFGRSRGTSNGTSTSVASGDRLGGIFFTGADGTDIESLAAVIQAKVDGTPGSNDMPGRLEFYTTPDGSETTVERMRIHSGGVVSISEGVELGNGFAGAASNTLDDYEEGTFTPVVQGASTAGAFNYVLQQGSYTKVGRLVSVFLTIYVDNTTTSAVGDLTITGLPFTAQNTNNAQYAGSVGWVQYVGFSAQLGFYIGGASTTALLRNITNGGSGTIPTGNDLGNAFYIIVSGQYHV